MKIKVEAKWQISIDGTSYKAGDRFEVSTDVLQVIKNDVKILGDKPKEKIPSNKMIKITKRK